jgi:CheY-like chemotaxis protein
MQTVLVADDDAEFRRFLRWVLEKGGYLVEEAHNGAEALVKLRSARPSVLLMDFDFGGPPDGGQVVASLRGGPEFGNLPVLFVTGSAEAGLARGETVLYKPVDPEVLVDAVRGLLEAVDC